MDDNSNQEVPGGKKDDDFLQKDTSEDKADELEDVLDFADKKSDLNGRINSDKELRQVGQPDNILDIDEDLRVKPTPSSQNNVLENPSNLSRPRKSFNWLKIGGGFLIVLLLAATAYYVFNQISFNQGIINFTFDPTGVDIIIDSDFEKEAVDSLIIKLKSGSHNIKVSKDGYLNLEREFYLVPGEDSDLHIELETIPEILQIVEEPVAFEGLANNGKTFVYLDSTGRFKAFSTDLGVGDIGLFAGSFDDVSEVIWSPGDPMAIVKIKGYPNLSSTYDNRNVKGRYIPLGESPEQGAAYRDGFSTWLFDDTRRTATAWKPVLLNESIRGVTFSPNGSQIMYFYETADGEKSLIVSNTDGVDWERVITQLTLGDPKLKWLNDDQYILVFDDTGKSDKLFDNVNKDFVEIMPERVANTKIESSPNGTKILYLANIDGVNRVAIWDIAAGERRFVLDEEATTYTWKADDEIIVSKADGTLWYWSFYNNDIQPVQFISSVGNVQPTNIMYTILAETLYIVEDSRVLTLKVY